MRGWSRADSCFSAVRTSLLSDCPNKHLRKDNRHPGNTMGVGTCTVLQSQPAIRSDRLRKIYLHSEGLRQPRQSFVFTTSSRTKLLYKHVRISRANTARRTVLPYSRSRRQLRRAESARGREVAHTSAISLPLAGSRAILHPSLLCV